MFVAEELQVVEELVETRAIRFAFARIDQGKFADRVKSEGVDDLARSFSSEKANAAYIVLAEGKIPTTFPTNLDVESTQRSQPMTPSSCSWSMLQTRGSASNQIPTEYFVATLRSS
jgi:hypothetical protein